MATKEQKLAMAQCADDVVTAMELAREAAERMRHLGIPLDDLPYPASEMGWRLQTLYEMCIAQDTKQGAVCNVVARIAQDVANCARSDRGGL